MAKSRRVRRKRGREAGSSPRRRLALNPRHLIIAGAVIAVLAATAAYGVHAGWFAKRADDDSVQWVFDDDPPAAPPEPFVPPPPSKAVYTAQWKPLEGGTPTADLTHGSVQQVALHGDNGKAVLGLHLPSEGER